MGFKVPAEIIAAPNKVVLNEKDDMQATRFVMERILGFTVGKIEVVNAK